MTYRNSVRLISIASAIGAAAAVLLAGSAPASAVGCRYYASQSVAQIKQRLRRGCGRGNTPSSWWARLPWHAHYRWCVQKSADPRSRGGPMPAVALARRRSVLAACHGGGTKNVNHYIPRWEKLTRTGRYIHGKSCRRGYRPYHLNGVVWCYYCQRGTSLVRYHGRMMCGTRR